jgi:hypothetical protein
MFLGSAARSRRKRIMDSAIFLARLIGPTFVAIALGMLINLGIYESMIAEALHTGILFTVLGEISKTGIIHATPTFEAVVSVIERTRADLVVWAGLLFGSGGLCARLTNASEENENDFRLLTRRCRRCRIAVLLDLRPAAARAILAPKEPALDWVSSGMPTWSQRALQAETRMSGINLEKRWSEAHRCRMMIMRQFDYIEAAGIAVFVCLIGFAAWMLFFA